MKISRWSYRVGGSFQIARIGCPEGKEVQHVESVSTFGHGKATDATERWIKLIFIGGGWIQGNPDQGTLLCVEEITPCVLQHIPPRATFREDAFISGFVHSATITLFEVE
jgi:hypothetical protein